MTFEWDVGLLSAVCVSGPRARPLCSRLPNVRRHQCCPFQLEFQLFHRKRLYNLWRKVQDASTDEDRSAQIGAFLERQREKLTYRRFSLDQKRYPGRKDRFHNWIIHDV